MKSFFDKITGGDDDSYNDDQGLFSSEFDDADENAASWMEDDQDLEMAVDVYQDQDNVYVKAFVPGLSASSLDVDISRDTVTIRCTREREVTVEDENYFQQELIWGTFARKIALPREVDIEGSEARAKDGMLTLTMPKIDKDRKAKLRVRAS